MPADFHNKKCECALCKSDFAFELDDFIKAELENKNCVIFVGAGVSTENRECAPHSLYDELLHEISSSDRTIAFPDAAELVCGKKDGRYKLMTIIQKRIDYINKFKQIRDISTRFFRELATIPYFDTFITTNLDRNIEDYCGAKPFVYDSDIRFWGAPERRVLKIHGTIDDYSSIIASRSDYIRRLSEMRESLVGAKIKEILSTKTCIFIGYSMKDDDFNDILSFVNESLGVFPKHHYFVTPDGDGAPKTKLITHIQTSGVFFLKSVKEYMCNNFCYLNDNAYEEIELELGELKSSHEYLWENYSAIQKPQILASACYQDGLIDGYQMIIEQRKTGRYSDLHTTQHLIHSYEKIISKNKKRKRFHDVAYFKGYQNAFLTLIILAENVQNRLAPHYYYEKIGEMDENKFEAKIDEFPAIHKSSFVQLQKISQRLEEGFVFQHSPWQ